MARLVLLGDAMSPSARALPALALLPHRVEVLPGVPGAMVDIADADVVLVDCQRDLVTARGLCRLVRTSLPDVPVVAVMTEGGLAAVSVDWGVSDVVLGGAGPAEVDARLRLAIASRSVTAEASQTPGEVVAGDVVIDEGTYTARVRRTVLDLTYKEFELLKFLATHPGRVFTRAQLLQEVWGYDYFGGTRTVDVHVRRLRAKLGDLEQLIGTVRNVGYRFNVYEDDQLPAPSGRNG